MASNTIAKYWHANTQHNVFHVFLPSTYSNLIKFINTERL